MLSNGRLVDYDQFPELTERGRERKWNADTLGKLIAALSFFAGCKVESDSAAVFSIKT